MMANTPKTIRVNAVNVAKLAPNTVVIFDQEFWDVIHVGTPEVVQRDTDCCETVHVTLTLRRDIEEPTNG